MVTTVKIWHQRLCSQLMYTCDISTRGARLRRQNVGVCSFLSIMRELIMVMLLHWAPLVYLSNSVLFFFSVNRNNVAPFVTLHYNLDWKVMTDSPRLPDTSCYEQENWERSLKKGGVDLCDRIHRKEGGTGAQFHMPEALSHSVSTPLYVTIAGIAWLRKQGHKSQWQQPERLPECRLTISYVTWTLDEEHSNGFTHCSSLEPVLKWKLNFPPWPISTS